MEKLKELQDAQNALAKKLQDHGNKQATWNAEDNALWVTLDKEYEVAKKAKEDEHERVKAAANVRERLEAIEADAKTSGHNPRIGRDGASLTGGPRNREFFSTPEDVAEGLQNQALALQGWMLAGRFGNDIRPEHHEAAKRCGVNFANPEIDLRIGGTTHFRNTQAPFKVGSCSRGMGFRNDMQVGKLSTGGALVGETLLAKLEMALLSYIGTMQVAEVIVTNNGEPFRWPTMDDTGNVGARIGESQDAGFGTSTDPKIGRLTLGAHTFHSNFLNVSRSLMTDSVIDLESLFGTMMGTRIGRKHNTDFTTGADVGNGPIGIVTAATAGNTTASASAVAPDEIIDLIHKVDPAYREQPGVGFMFHDAILQVYRKLKDGQGRYLWSNGTTVGEPDRLHGYPYWINQAMDSTISSGKKTALFGKLDEYKVRIVNGLRIQRLIERRAEYDEDVFIAYLRADGGLLDAGQHPVKYMTH